MRSPVRLRQSHVSANTCAFTPFCIYLVFVVFNSFFYCIWLFWPAYMCVYYVCIYCRWMSEEAIGFPWNCSFRWLWATMLVLVSKPWSYARTNALYCLSSLYDPLLNLNSSGKDLSSFLSFINISLPLKLSRLYLFVWILF